MHSRDSRPIAQTPPALDASYPPPARQVSQPGTGVGLECCDRCGSVKLIRVKACWRCEACGYKSDCNGW